MNTKTHILVVEDSPIDQELIQREIAQRLDVDAWFVFTGSEAIECLIKKKVDLVLLDLDLKKMQEDGVWVLTEMQRRGLNKPVAILTGTDRSPLIEASDKFPILANIQKPLDQKKINMLLETYWL